MSQGSSMNTPLNDALKPCPFCGSADIDDANLEGEYGFTCRQCGALAGHETYDQAIAAWNTRANTQESSAAQGAMGDAGIQCHNHPAEHNDLVVSGEHYSCLDCGDSWPLKVAQPTDATAQQDEQARREGIAIYKEISQPRVDLTDERSALIVLCRLQIAANKNRQKVIAWDEPETPKRILAELLANTAQGKPEHIVDANKMVANNMACSSCYGTGADVRGMPCMACFKFAPTAKKG